MDDKNKRARMGPVTPVAGTDDSIENVDSLIEKEKKRVKSVNENENNETFYISRDQVNEFNFFILNNGITKEHENVLGAVKDTIRFLLMNPVIQFNESMNAFTLKKVLIARSLLAKLKIHFPLFVEFDNNKIPKSSWGLNAIDISKVRIMVKVDSITSESIQKFIKKSVNDATINGWKGKLEIITASPVIITLP